jgi:hypothetical protein
MTPTQQHYKNTFFCIATHPFLPANDGSFTFINRSKDDAKDEVIPLFDNHSYEKGAIGYATAHYIPVYTLKDERNLCMVFASLHTDADLPLGTGISIGFGEVFHRGHVKYGDGVAEISIADIPSTPLCHTCEPHYVAQFTQDIRTNKFIIPNFSKLLESIGEKV